MITLDTTSDVLRITPGTAGALHWHAVWADLTGTSFTGWGGDEGNLTSTTTTNIVSAPGSGVDRKVKHVSLHNTSSSVTTTINVEVFNGTSGFVLFNCTLLPDEHLHYYEARGWAHTDAQGAEYTYTTPATANLGATGTLAETIPRELCPEVNTTAGAGGTLFLQAIYLTAGQLISNITVWSATTAAATTTNLFFALYDGNRNLQAQSANQGAYTWAANSVKTLAMTTAYRVTVSGLYYIGVMQAATTIATLKGGTAKTGGQLAAAAPILNGTSTTGLTTSLPNPAAAITAGTASIYAAVS